MQTLLPSLQTGQYQITFAADNNAKLFIGDKEILSASDNFKFDEYDALVVNYAMLKMKLNGKVPYKWLGFLPQLYGVECGDGIENKLVD